MVSLLDAAREYAERGWPVFPVRTDIAKKPHIKEWPTAASTDPDQIARWWKRWPEANVAIVTGARSGVVAIDLDGDEVGGDAYGALICEQGSPGPDWCTDGASMRTGRDEGGWRLLFRIPEGVTIRKGLLAPGVEFMGNGGSATMPPSLHASGRRYVWRDEVPPRGLPELAPKWVALMAPPVESRRPVTLPARASFEGGGTSYGLAALRGELERLAGAAEGTRNHTLNTAAFAVGSLAAAGHLDLSLATQALAEVAIEIGLGRDEATQTLESGLRAGLQNPRPERAA